MSETEGKLLWLSSPINIPEQFCSYIWRDKGRGKCLKSDYLLWKKKSKWSPEPYEERKWPMIPGHSLFVICLLCILVVKLKHNCRWSLCCEQWFILQLKHITLVLKRRFACHKNGANSLQGTARHFLIVLCGTYACTSRIILVEMKYEQYMLLGHNLVIK